MTTPLLIYGCGGHGREILALIADMCLHGSSYEVVGFVSDDVRWQGQSVAGTPVLSWPDAASSDKKPGVVLGMGSPVAKRRVVERLGGAARFPAMIHPTAQVGPRVEIGEGVVIAAGSVLTCDISVEPWAMINRLCNVGHDCRVGAYGLIGPGCNLSGGVTVEEGCELGTGVDAIPGVSVGAWSIVGAGAVLTRDVPGNSTAVGVPARVVSQRSDGWHLHG